jgi:hypothetical protein
MQSRIRHSIPNKFQGKELLISGSCYWTPRNFNVVLVNPDGVDQQYAHITWTAATFETEIYRSLDGGEFTLLTTVAPNVGEYDDQLMDGNEHTAEYYGRFKSDTTVLNIPTGLAVAVISGGYRITGTVNNTEADHIEIQANVDSAGYGIIQNIAVSGSTFTYDYILAGSHIISFKVRAKEGTLPVYSGFTSEITITPADNLIARMTAADGVAPTAPRQAAIRTAVASLIAANLWSTQFDSLVVYRGKGAASTKLNWIADVTNALGVNNPTYTEDVGYNTDGSSSYINTKYNPAVNGVLWKLNDACWGFKVSGTLGTPYFGELGAAYTTLWSADASNVSLNSAYTASENFTAGYNCVSRDDATHIRVMRNSGINTYNQNSIGLTGTELYLLRLNYGGMAYYAASTLKLEMEWKGKALSQAKFLTFQTIMNTYFASL